MNTYYLQIKSTDEYLDPYEIAKKYNIYNIKDKPNGRFVARLLTEFLKDKGIEDLKYYKRVDNNMVRVYPQTIYGPLLESLVNNNLTNKEIYMEFDNKTHCFIIKK